jgi:hypothetical protein
MPTRLVFSLFLVLAIASRAAAQGQQPTSPPPSSPPAQTSTGAAGVPTFEVGLGYQFLRAGEFCFDDNEEDCSPSRNFPLGFAIDGVRNFGALGVVAEVGWSRHAEDITNVLTGESTLSEHLFHYAGGVRFTGHNAGRAWPYGQVLIGGATIHTSTDFDDESLANALESSNTRTRFIIQPGIGITLVGGDGWGAFGQVDYRRLFLKEDEDAASGRNDVRVYLGLRVMLD